MSYVFYDTETTGTETAFDQILQFAAIKTDDNFRELEQFNIRCRLLPHIVPSPGALRVTRVTPSTLTDRNLPSHYEAIQKIQAKMLVWSPAVFMGFNSIAFDEDLLRQSLFQTLHPAYLTNTSGNTRADVMRIAHAVSVYAPNSITVPLDEKGMQTFKLDRLAPANGFAHDDAHEAMADVKATIHMARLIRERAPQVWSAMERTTRKATVKKYVEKEPILSLTERHFGRTNSYLISYCGTNPEYDGQIGVFDLHHDPDKYRSMSAEELVKVLNANQKPIRSLRANAQPILMPADTAPSETKALQVDAEERNRRADVIRRDVKFHESVGKALALRFADEEPSPYIEQRIYDGFPGPKDQVRMTEFHKTDWKGRVVIASMMEDERLREFAYRLIYFEKPDALPQDKRTKLEAWTSGRVLSEDEDVPWMTVAKAMREADGLLKKATGEDARLLQDVKNFLRKTAKQHG